MNDNNSTKEKPAENANETPEVKPLSDAEKQKLSRETILKWHRAKSMEKLKALQEEIISSTLAERENIKEKIISNTKKELEKHKELSEKEREKIAKSFADEIIGVGEGIGTIDGVVEKFKAQEEDREKFYAYMHDYVGKDKEAALLKKLGSDKDIKTVVALISKNNPEDAKRIEALMNEGDYEGAKKIIVKGSGGHMQAALVDQLFAAAVLGEAGIEKKTGNQTFDAVIANLNKLRTVGHGFVLHSAAKDLNVPFMFVMRISKLTLKEMQDMDANLTRNRYLIDEKEKQTPKEMEQVMFINSMHKLLENMMNKIEGDKNLKQRFDEGINLYLDSKKELTFEDKEHLRNQIKFEDLRMLQIFDLVYGDDESRSKILAHSFARIPTLVRAYRNTFGDASEVNRVMRKYHAKKISDWAHGLLQTNAKSWNLENIVKKCDALDSVASKTGQRIETEMDKLHQKSSSYKLTPEETTSRQGIIHEDIIKHDEILKEYENLAQQATRIMTLQAKDVIAVGKHLETMQKSAGAGFANKNLGELPHISDQSLEKLYPGKKASEIRAMGLKGNDLVRAYGDRLVNLKTMEDVTRTRFAVLAENIDQKVVQGLSGELNAKFESNRAVQERMQIKKGVDELKTPGKIKSIAKTAALPAIIIGFEGYYLLTGKAKTREVMWDLGEAAAGFVPVVGTTLDFKAAISGQSLSGKKLGTKERISYAAFGTIGAISDLAWALGGLGAGLRMGLGGVRAAGRSVEAGKTLGKGMREVAHAKELPYFQEKLGKMAVSMSKASRAEAAVDASVTAKAMEQARLMNKHGLSDMSKVDEAIAAARQEGKMDAVRDLEKLKQTYNEISGGIDFKKMFEAAKGGQALEIPSGFLSGIFFRAKEAFLSIKAQLLSIGIPAETIKNYERTFDQVNQAKKVRNDAMVALKEKSIAKQADLLEQEAAYRKIAYDTNLTDVQKNYVKASEEFAKFEKEKDLLKGKVLQLEQRHKKLEEAFKNKTKINGKEVTRAELNEAEKALKEANIKKTKEFPDREKKLLDEKKLTESKLEHNKKWKEEYDQTSGKIRETEQEIVAKERDVYLANEQLHFANTERSMMEAQMLQKAEDFARTSQYTSSVARALQYGGLAMGGIWAFSGFNAGPAEQYQAVKKYAPKVASAGGSVINEVYFEDHSGTPAIDQLVEKRVSQVKFRKELEGLIDKGAQAGESQEVVLARHWESDEAKEIAKKRGLLERIQKGISDGKLKVQEKTEQVVEAAKHEVATADGVRKDIEKRIS